MLHKHKKTFYFSAGFAIFSAFSLFLFNGINTSNLKAAVFMDSNENSNTQCTQIFTDVPCDSPYFNVVKWAKDTGVTQGCGHGAFCGTGLVTREQTILMTMRLFYPGLINPKTQEPLALATVPYTDIDSLPVPSINAIKAAYGLGILSKSTGFSPSNNITLAPFYKIAFGLGQLFSPATEGTPWYKIYMDYAAEKQFLPKGLTNPSYANAFSRFQFVDMLYRISKLVEFKKQNNNNNNNSNSISNSNTNDTKKSQNQPLVYCDRLSNTNTNPSRSTTTQSPSTANRNTNINCVAR